MTGHVRHNDQWPWSLSSRSISQKFAIKLLKYGTSYHVCLTTSIVPHGLFPYLAQRSLARKGLSYTMTFWPWPISSRSFSHDFVIKLLNMHILLCPLYSMDSSKWILSILGSAQMITGWEGVSYIMVFELTYIFKVIHPWICNKTAKIWHFLSWPLYNMYSLELILFGFIFGIDDH